MSESGANDESRFEGSVTAAFPLALLTSMRAHDHPGEVLEDEDLSVSLPRRLGLTGVVETQIMRYEGAQKARRQVPLSEVVNLLRLVMRRPDRDPILRETGQRYARWWFRRTPGVLAALRHRAPNLLGMRTARRATVRALDSVHAGASIEATKPFHVQVTETMTTRLENDGSACMLLTGMIEEILVLSTGVPHRISHSDCLTNGARACEWILLEHA